MCIYEHLYTYAFCIEVHCRKSFHIIEWCVCVNVRVLEYDWMEKLFRLNRKPLHLKIHTFRLVRESAIARIYIMHMQNEPTYYICMLYVYCTTYIYLMNSKFSINGRRRVNLRAMHHQHFSRGNRDITLELLQHIKIRYTYTQKKNKNYMKH